MYRKLCVMPKPENKGYDPLNLIHKNELNFEYWVDLYRDTPEEFEKQRSLIMDTVLEQMPERYRKRSEGLLFKIDAARRNPETPMKNCIEISKMMWESMSELNKIAAAPISYINDKKQKSASVIEFK